MPELIFLEQAPSRGREHLPDAVATIGREGCALNIEDPEISRRHAAIRSEGGALIVEDLGSTNGTFVNGERISGATPLSEGDEVRFGGTIWRVQPPPGVAAPARAVVAEPQVTVARSVPAPGRPAEPAPPAAAPQSVTAPQPSAAPQASGARRGDVPPPSFAPSAIRRVVPPPGGPVPFTPSAPATGRGSAARRQGATAFVTLSVALTTVGVVLYYVTEPFK